MAPEAVAVLVAAALATSAMILYVSTILPKKLDERFRESLKAFSLAVELRFPSHEGNTSRCISLSKIVGHRLHLNGQQMRNLEMAAWLRDIGLCAIPYRLVNGKPMLDWTEADHATYERHPEVSGAMLELVPSLKHLAGIVRCHHVSFDGSMGPFFPSRADLPIESRILKVVTDYVWLERRQGNLLARQHIRDEAGTIFDPAVVEAFVGVLTSTRVEEPAEPVTV